MTDYYCDIEQGVFSDNTGTSVGTAYAGPSGLQAAIRGTGNATALAAGDTLYIKAGTGDLSRLVLLDCDGTDVSHWAPGDTVRNFDGAVDWTGVIVQANDDPAGNLGADDLVLVWLDSGYTQDDIDLADGIENVDQLEAANLVAKSTPGIKIDTNSGDGDDPIEIVGVNAAWADDGTPAVLDGNDKAANGLVAAGPDYIRPRNIHVRDTTSHGLDVTSASYYWHLANCWFEGCGGSGINGDSLNYSTLYRCRAFDISGAYGLYVSFSNVYHCTAYNCAGIGIYAKRATAAGCVAFENVDGFKLALGGSIIGCVADKNADGVTVSTGGEGMIVACRITNNTAFGISGDYTWYDPYTFYGGNDANWEHANGNDLVDGESTRVTTGTIGYIDNDDATPNADRNYGLTNQAAARRQEVLL